MLPVVEDRLTTHSAIRVNYKRNEWEVVNLFTKTVVSVDYKSCLILILFMNGKNTKDALEEINKVVHIEEDDFHYVLNTLVQKGMLVSENDESHKWTASVIDSWSKYGWRKSADYHILTYDYPFLDYRGEGRNIDYDLMDFYGEEEPDTYRGKKYPKDKIRSEIIASNPIQIIKKLNAGFSLNKKSDLTKLNKEKIVELMSLCFGVLRNRKVPTENAADLVRKISPSGGARHPSEGYLFNLSIDSLEKGIYHFSSITSTLDYINEIPGKDTLLELFSGPYRADFTPEAFIVITSEFERNMYRYREPRTFRTIYMDVGHIVENINQICGHIGINSFQHHGIDDSKIEKLLAINYLKEGAIISIAIGGKE